MREDPEQIAGLVKGLALIEAFGEGRHARLTISEASDLTGLSRAAARRCLRTLEQLGYVSFDGKYFAIAARVLRLGHAYVSTSRLVTLVQPLIEASSERNGRVHVRCGLGLSRGAGGRTLVRQTKPDSWPPRWK